MTLIIARTVLIDLEKKMASFRNHDEKKILEMHYVGPEAFKKYPFLKNWYGATQDRGDCEGEHGVHIVGPYFWKEEPTIGDCCYALLDYEEDVPIRMFSTSKGMAQIADKMTELMTKFPQITPLLDATTGECYGAQTEERLRRQSYWLSHPITAIQK